MQYKDSVISVSTSGLYYVYVQMYYLHINIANIHTAGFRIRVNGNGLANAIRFHQQKSFYIEEQYSVDRKLYLMIKKLKRLGTSIAGIQETKWFGNDVWCSAMCSLTLCAFS